MRSPFEPGSTLIPFTVSHEPPHPPANARYPLTPEERGQMKQWLDNWARSDPFWKTNAGPASGRSPTPTPLATRSDCGSSGSPTGPPTRARNCSCTSSCLRARRDAGDGSTRSATGLRRGSGALHAQLGVRHPCALPGRWAVRRRDDGAAVPCPTISQASRRG